MAPQVSSLQLILNYLEARATWVAIALVFIATVRIVSTYTVLNHTHDEPAHVAAGMEWLDKGVYKWEPQHPPLTRVAAALLPKLDGGHSWGRNDMWNEGVALLYRGKGYDRTLSLARAGVLPFFWIACAVVFLWVRRYFGELHGVMAVLLMTLTPAVLAHAGLATTDMGLTAFLLAALFSTLLIVEAPSWKTGFLWGLCVGLGMVAKFSFLPFYPACAVAALVLVWWRVPNPERPALPKVGRLAVAATVGAVAAFVAVWAMYRFSFGPNVYTKTALPFPELFSGIEAVRAHNAAGHPTYLLGAQSNSGFWFYYPIALFFKSPIALMVPATIGAVKAWTARSYRLMVPLGFAAGLLLFASTSRINIGTRHVLPVFVFMAIVGAAGLVQLLQSSKSWQPKAGLALLAWLVIASAWIHPDYIAYFNELAGHEPEKIVVDSDLDWGQDVKRAGRRLQELGAQWVAYRPFIPAYEQEVHGFPPVVEFDPVNGTPGWSLVSLTNWKVMRFNQPPNTLLLMDRLKPRERVGRGMLLYYIPPPPGTRQQLETVEPGKPKQ